MNSQEQTAAVELVVGLWPEWKATGVQRDLLRDIFRPYTLTATAVILRRHRREQKEGRDYAPNLKTISLMLDSYQEYRGPDDIQQKWQNLYYSAGRLGQAILDDLICRRALHANRFESKHEREKCELRLESATRTIEANAQRDTFAACEAAVAEAMNEMDTFARQTK